MNRTLDLSISIRTTQPTEPKALLCFPLQLNSIKGILNCFNLYAILTQYTKKKKMCACKSWFTFKGLFHVYMKLTC